MQSDDKTFYTVEKKQEEMKSDDKTLDLSLSETNEKKNEIRELMEVMDRWWFAQKPRKGNCCCCQREETLYPDDSGMMCIKCKGGYIL